MLVRFSVALAELALQSPDWEDPVRDVMQALMSPTAVHARAALQFIVVLPEELVNVRVPIDAARRERFRRYLSSVGWAYIQPILQTELNSTADSQARAIKMLASWIAAKAVPLNVVLESQLLQFAFEVRQYGKYGNYGGFLTLF